MSKAPTKSNGKQDTKKGPGRFRTEGAQSSTALPADASDRNASRDLLAGTSPTDTSKEAIQKREAAMADYLEERRVTHAEILQGQLDGKTPQYVRFVNPSNPADAVNVAFTPEEGDEVLEATLQILQARLESGEAE